jgi:hypothetical protein
MAVMRPSFTGRKGTFDHWSPTQRTDEFSKAIPMGLFKADFYRFFALGFAGGALLVLGVMGIGGHSPLADDFAPAAQAAETH